MEGELYAVVSWDDQCGESCCPWNETRGNFLAKPSELNKVDSFVITGGLSRRGGKYQVRENAILGDKFGGGESSVSVAKLPGCSEGEERGWKGNSRGEGVLGWT